jgi:hypothetical protein
MMKRSSDRLSIRPKTKSPGVAVFIGSSNRSQVQGSTFRVKDKKGIKDPKFSLKMLISQIIANYSALKNSIFRVANFGLSLTKLTLFSYIRIPYAVQGREWNLEPLNL